MSIFTKAQIFDALCIPKEEIIDWAISLLIMGYDSPNLRILAGLTKLDSHSEVTYYVNQTLQELNIPKLKGKTAIIAYTSILLQEFLDGKISQDQAISELNELCLS